MFEISPSSVQKIPASLFNSSILFLLYLWDARLWKNLVFWSPSFSHKALDLFFHIFSSLINNPFISHFNWLTASIVPPLVALSSACFSCCFFSFKAWVILPNETQFHCFNFAWHSFILPSTCIIGLLEKFRLQARSTTSLHPASSSHICSNPHDFRCLIWIPFNWMIKGLWFDDPHSKCTTFVAGNMFIQSMVATARSNLSQMVLPPYTKCIFLPQSPHLWTHIRQAHPERLPFVSLVWTCLPIFHLFLWFH